MSETPAPETPTQDAPADRADASTGAPSRTPEMVLREPSERVSPRAKTMWRVAALPFIVVLVLAMVVLLLVDEVPGVVVAAVGFVLAAQVAYAVFMPSIRYRVHRWEVTHEAFYTRSGWISRDVRIIPLNRVQTVDSSQGALERGFGLASVRVTTASGYGTAYVRGLEEGHAKQVVAGLVRDTAAVEGDAT